MKKLKIIFASVMVMIISLSATVFGYASDDSLEVLGQEYTYDAFGSYSDFYVAGTRTTAYTVLVNKAMESKKLSVQVKEYTKGTGWTQSEATEANCRYGAQVMTDYIGRDWLSEEVYYYHTGQCSEINYNRRYDDFIFRALQY